MMAKWSDDGMSGWLRGEAERWRLKRFAEPDLDRLVEPW
jgi:hypothetical protein